MRIYSTFESLHAPHLLDLEFAQAVRKLVRENTISVGRGQQVLGNLLRLRIVRYPHSMLLSRVWQLRNNLTAYDAAYVALAEELGASLITCDAKLHHAHGHRANVEVFHH